jgi:hypothetical protein
MHVVAYALAGIGIGAVTGWVVYRMTKGRQPGLVKDALLGSFGYVGGIISCPLMPWPENTVIKQLAGGGSVATTMSRYQHPPACCFCISDLFPATARTIQVEEAQTCIADIIRWDEKVDPRSRMALS